MANFNKVLLMGNLTRDPEVRYTTNGSVVANTTIAVNEKYRNANGEDITDTCFLDLEIWGKQAETLKQYTQKGSPIFVEGRLRQDTWQDKATGQNRSRIRIRVERFQLLPRGGQQSGGGFQPGQQSQPMAQPQQPQQYNARPQQVAQNPMPAAPNFGNSQPAAPSQPQQPAPNFGQSAPVQPQANTMPPAPTFMPVDEPEDDIPF